MQFSAPLERHCGRKAGRERAMYGRQKARRAPDGIRSFYIGVETAAHMSIIKRNRPCSITSLFYSCRPCFFIHFYIIPCASRIAVLGLE